MALGKKQTPYLTYKQQVAQKFSDELYTAEMLQQEFFDLCKCYLGGHSRAVIEIEEYGDASNAQEQEEVWKELQDANKLYRDAFEGVYRLLWAEMDHIEDFEKRDNAVCAVLQRFDLY